MWAAWGIILTISDSQMTWNIKDGLLGFFCLKSFHYSTLFYHSDLLLLETDYEKVCVCV